MSHKKDNDRLRTQRQLDKLKWETANELGLKDERSEPASVLRTHSGPTPQGNTSGWSARFSMAVAVPG